MERDPWKDKYFGPVEEIFLPKKSTSMEDKTFVWPFPNNLLPTEPLDKLPFNPDNEEDAPI
jgi:hypothetical protein